MTVTQFLIIQKESNYKMKKRILSIILICSIVINICSMSVFAFSTDEQKSIAQLVNNSIVLSTKTPVCFVWGEQTYVDRDNLSVMPIIENNRTLVPVRFIAESLGANVNWDELSQKVTIALNSDIITVTINADYMYVNDKKVSLDVPAQTIEERTLIPLRAISKALDKKIFYHNGFILVSDYDIDLDSNNNDVQRLVEYLRYTMLVYDKDNSSQISFMNKSVKKNNFKAIYANSIPFESDRNKLVSATSGMYIENLKCIDVGSDNYSISMDIYNTAYTYGVVEFYDANGNWLGSNRVDKYESIGTSLENTLTNAWEGTFGIGWAIGEGIAGDWSNLQYRNSTISKHTHIERIIPNGSYLYITNNIEDSSYVAMYDMVSIAVESVALASDWIDTFGNSGEKKEFLDSVKENIMEKLSDEAFESIITNTQFANIIAADYSLGSISDYIANVVEKTILILKDNNIDISQAFQNTAKEMGRNIIVGTAESLLKKAMSFIGTALNICFNLGKTCNFASFIIDIRKSINADSLLLIAGYEGQPDVNVTTTFSLEIGEVNGETYSIRNVHSIKLLPVETYDKAISSFCYYNGYVYYVLTDEGSDGYSTWLYRCDSNWENEELLDYIIFDYSNINTANGHRYFIIDNNTLYYDSDWQNNKVTAINLADMSKFQTYAPQYTIDDNGKLYGRDYSSGYNIAIYDDITFFTDKNNNLYRLENGTKHLLATNAYIDGGIANGYLYFAVYDYKNDSQVYLQRVPISGGNSEYIDSTMPAGGGGPYFSW